jgi:hypothetical protein
MTAALLALRGRAEDGDAFSPAGSSPGESFTPNLTVRKRTVRSSPDDEFRRRAVESVQLRRGASRCSEH